MVGDYMDLKLIYNFLVASLFTGTWFADFIWLLFQVSGFFSNFDHLLDQQHLGSNVENNSNLHLTKQATTPGSGRS